MKPVYPVNQRSVKYFWDHVVPAESGCWVWEGEKDSYGYGLISIERKRFQRWKAHRFSCRIHNGVEPFEGACALHSCDNPACVNPEHLRWGTKKDNTQDMMARGRNNHGVCPEELNPARKLCSDDVVKIRRLFAANVPKDYIAKKFAVTKTNVWYIVTHQTWKHVP